MKIYVDVGNTNIKILDNNELYILNVNIINIEYLITKYKTYEWIIIFTNKNKQEFIDVLTDSNINFKNIVNNDLIDVKLNKNINRDEIGIDILLASKYLNDNNGVIIINGTVLLSVLIINSCIESISLQMGTHEQNKFINNILNLNDNYEFTPNLGTNTHLSMNLGNFLNVNGIINYYYSNYNVQNFVLTGNGFKNMEIKNFVNSNYKIEFIDNLVLKMLEKSF